MRWAGLVGMALSVWVAAGCAANALTLKTTIEDGYLIEEGFLNVTIGGSPVLLQGLIVKKADAVGRLPIMLYAHGETGLSEKRQEMTPRGVHDANVRLIRDYARRGWLGVFVLRRAYGESDGPYPVEGFQCERASPSFQDWMEAAADDLEATLDHIARRDDADASRIMAIGVSGGGGAVVALSARNIPGLKVVVNVSGGFGLVNCEKNAERLTEAMRYYGTKAKVANLWYYAKNDSRFPERTVVAARAAFLEGGGYARLVHYPAIPNSDGHQLWGKQAATVMLDVDGFLRTHGLPTWDKREVQSLVDRFHLARFANAVELYVASPGYKALAKSTGGDHINSTYSAPSQEIANTRSIKACQERQGGQTCALIDPPAAAAAPADRGHSPLLQELSKDVVQPSRASKDLNAR